MAGAWVEAGKEGGTSLQNGLLAIARGGRRRLLVDITEIMRLDVKTGIQRVTRNSFCELVALSEEAGCFDVEPFHWSERGICYARKYARTQLGMPCDGDDDVVCVQPSDLVFMLDSSWWSPERFGVIPPKKSSIQKWNFLVP